MERLRKHVAALVMFVVWCGATTHAFAYDWDAYEWEYNPVTDHYYALTFSQGGWSDAEIEAQALDPRAHLVTVNHLVEGVEYNENAWLLSTFENAGWDRLWIGYNSEAAQDPTGPYAWVGEELDPGSIWDGDGYTNWAPGEPNNIPGEFYAEMYMIDEPTGNPGEWNNAPDGTYSVNQHPGIIEAPEPSALTLLTLASLYLIKRRR